MTTERLVNVEQSLQKLRYTYQFQITYKGGEIGFSTDLKFTKKQYDEVKNLIDIIKIRKAEAVKVLENTKAIFIQGLIDNQKYCTPNYDLYMDGLESVQERWEACLISFSHSEYLLARDFDYGLTCIHEVTEQQAIETLERDEPQYLCPDEAPMICRYCEKKEVTRIEHY